MAGLSLDHPYAFAFGILGNLISFMVYLAPLPTFYRVYKRKSTEGFQSVPYVVALFSAMLWIYYAFVKTNMFLLITINTFGCFVETVYILMFLHYAPRKAKIYTLKLMFLFNVILFGSIVLLTMLLTKGENRAILLGWICVAFAVSVFAAPLSIIKLVIKTKSVEFMPFYLSLFLTLSAVCWFGYGLLSKDIYVAIPNILGFLFGMTQMVLYTVYKNCKKVSEEKVISDSITIVVVPDHQIIKEKEVEIPSHEGDHEQNKGTAVTNDEENVITKSTVAA
ncbi:bidirectional sugar transporter SWEET13-like [Dioscorea cayenensis subsp. rotundata]|uniref:Bidirectional sugar transporter SWEET n=1 Tax=Dioscorea cayennensis subsp. rotundata TaxID=55577 RepID=A0AB40BEW7_DIOCR|nr:bidirectional sugar transporter SWEET13-like [Dioscorea cayenensis subsp. rotundata]